MQNLRNNMNQSWKNESLIIFKAMLKNSEEEEDYESCAKLLANIKYLEKFMEAPNLAEFPHPYELYEDSSDQSIFLEFVTKTEEPPIIEEEDTLDSRIKKYLDSKDDLQKKRKKRNK